MNLDFICVGKIVDTHGIKGELRIISDFPYKDKIFKIGFPIYIGEDKKKEIIRTYRRHKQYDMVTFDNYTNINEVYSFLKNDVYVVKSDLDLKDDEYIIDDLIGLDIIIDEEYCGQITEIFESSPNHQVIRFVKNGNSFLVPYVKSFIKNIDLNAKKMILYSKEGVIKCE